MQDGEVGRLHPEAQAQVEGEGGVVAELGVDHRPAHAPPPQPAQAVEGQRPAHARPPGGGGHRQALEVALVAGPAGDGVADDQRPVPPVAPGSAASATRNRVDGVAVSASSSPPRSSRQKGLKEPASTSSTDGQSAGDRLAQVVRAGGGAQGHARQVVGQEPELLVGGEARRPGTAAARPRPGPT